MEKELGSNDQPQPRSKDPRDQQKLRGKAFQVNENSVEEGEPIRPPAPPKDPTSDNGKQQKVEGKAFQVNENSIEDQEPIPPRRQT
jgi:uncharacterized protein YlzI (FlbEa/FlbD family)